MCDDATLNCAPRTTRTWIGPQSRLPRHERIAFQFLIVADATGAADMQLSRPALNAAYIAGCCCFAAWGFRADGFRADDRFIGETAELGEIVPAWTCHCSTYQLLPNRPCPVCRSKK